MTPTRSVLAFLALLAIAAATFAFVLANQYWLSKETEIPTIQLELFKELMQFVTVGVAGAFGTIVFRWLQQARESAERALERERQARAAEREFIRSVFSQVLDTYNEIKLTRRMFRAAFAERMPAFAIKEDEYNRIFLRLEAAQLSLEKAKKLVMYNQEHFKEVGGTQWFYITLGNCEDYVGGVLKEFENGAHERREGLRVLQAESKTAGFVAELSDDAKVNFFTPMGEIEEKVARLLSQ
jgi:hypothetical protein